MSAVKIKATRDFYPRPPRGGRQKKKTLWNCLKKFLSTPSARRATFVLCGRAFWLAYFYPRPPRGGRPLLDPVLEHPEAISIHALREEGDGSYTLKG